MCLFASVNPVSEFLLVLQCACTCLVCVSRVRVFAGVFYVSLWLPFGEINK